MELQHETIQTRSPVLRDVEVQIGTTITIAKSGNNRRMLKAVGVPYSTQGGYYTAHVPMQDQKLTREDVLARWTLHSQMNR